MTQISERDTQEIRDILGDRDRLHGHPAARARNLVGTLAVSQLRMNRKVMSWRVARNPLFHDSVSELDRA
jgi:hypothetical protein